VISGVVVAIGVVVLVDVVVPVVVEDAAVIVNIADGDPGNPPKRTRYMPAATFVLLAFISFQESTKKLVPEEVLASVPAPGVKMVIPFISVIVHGCVPVRKSGVLVLSRKQKLITCPGR
jgi:hypothetical protein